MAYHYTNCGLPDVFLKNGYAKVKTSYGTFTKVHNVLGLHKAIADTICKSPQKTIWRRISLFKERNGAFSKKLGCQIGADEQKVRRWENDKNKQGIDPMADLLIRQLYLEYINGNQSIRELIERINQGDSDDNDRFKLELCDDHWQRAA